MGLFLFAVLIIIAVICYFRIEKVTQVIDLIITEREIDNYGEGVEILNQDAKLIQINIYENSDGGEYIQEYLLSYLDYEGNYKENVKKKWIYHINDSKVSKFEKGHVVLGHPVVTFLEG